MTLTVAATAYSIAAVRAEERELFEDPYAKHFVAAGEHAREGTERYLSLPFFRDGIRLRTRYLDDAVREAARDGFEQFVLLGAGFDARALRMSELAGKHVYEVDGREQMNRKREILEGAGVTIPKTDIYVPVDDFTIEAFTSALASAGFDRERAVFFVWEGVIGYIGDDEIDANLRFMANAAKRSLVVFTFGMESYAPRVTKLGFGVREELAMTDIWRRYLPGEPPDGAAYSMCAIIESPRSKTG